MAWIYWSIVILGSLLALARLRVGLAAWTAALGAVLLLAAVADLAGPIALVVLGGVWLAVLVPLNLPALRRRLLSAPARAAMARVLPPISETERRAIEAGTVWWEAELFRGAPRWERLLSLPAPVLTPREQAFLDGPVEELCGMLDDWRITHELFDLPPEVWAFLRRQRFFGMIIPRAYGGLEFSTLAHSAVVMKIASRSISAAVTVMVPNSLGPAELLLRYGTDAQRRHFLPRLARGEEVPCFALTGPTAGSDAGSIPDRGVVCRGRHQGREVLGLRLSWEKRYITLAPVATLLGLAFKVEDPDYLLGGRERLGITCALVPVTTPGVRIGRRHRPANAAFQNGPTSGHEVFIPLDWVIGGREGVGEGWRMLVECLSAGRGISLPALSAGAAKLSARMSGAYARVRRQFRLPIGRFEGVEEALARIAGSAYWMDAGRLLTASGLDAGERPAVVTAMTKYRLTEGMRQVVNDAMDVHAGRAICGGPANYLAGVYQSLPIAITVEGANILTRGLIVFGQGALRCHPYLLREMEAAADPDPTRGLATFDRALFGHLGYALANLARSWVLGLTGGRLAALPGGVAMRPYYRRLARMSAAFAVVADLTLLSLGGALKRREKLSGRLADALSALYLCSASLKRFEDSGRPAADRPLVEWACRYCLYEVQSALDGVLRNLPTPWLGRLLRPVVFPLGRRLRYPDDGLGHRVAETLLVPGEVRDRLTEGLYVSHDPEDVTGRVEHALAAVVAADSIERRLREAGHSRPPGPECPAWLESLSAQGLLEAGEAERLREAHRATRAAIDVDDFPGHPARSQRAVAEEAA